MLIKYEKDYISPYHIDDGGVHKKKDSNGHICQYSLTNMTSEYGNPVDACVAMIIKLSEREIL